MKIFSRILPVIWVLFSLAHFSFKEIPDEIDGMSYACNNPPVIASPPPAATSIGSTSAVLGGNITGDGGGSCSITERGIYWAVDPAAPISGTRVVEGGTSTGTFSFPVNSITSGSKINYAAFAKNSNGEVQTTTAFFFTLSTEPASYITPLTATTVSPTQIDLSFPSATASGVSGYIVLRNTGSAPTTAGVSDANAPGTGTFYIGNVPAGAGDNAFSDMTATAGNAYFYTILPYRYNGTNNETYNYRTTSGFPVASASTITVTTTPHNTPLTNGVADDPLGSGNTDQAILGFDLNPDGSINFTGITIQLSSNPSGKLSNFRLFSSADDMYDGGDSDLGTASNVTATQAIFSGLSQSLAAATDHYFFVVADVAAGVTSTSGQLQASFGDADVTYNVSASTTGGPITGIDYSFLDIIDPTATVFSPVDGATNVSSNPTLVVTFSENIQKSATAVVDDNDRVRVRLFSTDADAFTPIDKTSSNIVVSGNQMTITLPSALSLSTQYYVTIGNDVIQDIEGNAYAGTPTKGDWDFTTNSGVTVTAPSTGVCVGSYVTLSPVVIAETTPNNIGGINSSSRTLVLKFDNPGFVFLPGTTGVNATAGGDINSITVTSVTFSTATFTVNFDANATDETETITITGLKVSTDGSSGVTPGYLQKDASSTLSIEGITNNTTTLGTATNGSAPGQPGAPVFSVGTGTYCNGSSLAGITVSVSGSSIQWYSDALLTNQIGTGSPILIGSGLGINSAVTGTTTVYATQTTGCQGPARAVSITIAPLPVADAGIDLTAGSAVCFGSGVTLGGAPTLSIPSVPGAYTYAWTSTEPSFINPGNVPNPVVTMPTPGSLVSYTYSVAITDANGCTSASTALSTKTVFIKPDFTVTLSSPPTNSFSYQNAPVVLSATPTGGTFSGPGVINTGAVPNPYSFDPGLVYNVGTGGTQNFPVTYTATSGGCQKTVSPIVTFSVFSSNSPFGGFPDNFCSTEYPTAGYNPGVSSSYAPIQITSAAAAQVLNFVNSYNISNPATPITFTGRIRNYYQGYYGGAPTQSVVLTSAPNYPVSPPGHPGVTGFPQYGFLTDVIYNGCPTCNFAFLGMYVEFLNFNHAASVFGLTPGIFYDNGYVFYDPANGRSGFYFTGAFVQQNRVPVVSLNGVTNGANICKQDLAGNAFTYNLTGTFPSGTFEVSFDGTTYKKDIPSGNAVINPGPGFGILDSKNSWTGVSTYVAANNTWNSGTNYKTNDNVIFSGKFYRAISPSTNAPPNTNPALWQANTLAMPVRYSYDPGTVASDDTTPCFAYSTVVVHLHDNPTVQFSGVPANGTVFCQNDAPITLTATQSTGMFYSGGTWASDNSNGINGTFSPPLANATGNTQLSRVVNARHTDIYGCQAEDIRTYVVNPRVSAILTVPRATYCNEDVPVSLTGNSETFNIGLGTVNGTGDFSIAYNNTANVPTTTTGTGTVFNFDPKALYVQSFGSTTSSTQNFVVTYTETLVATKTCTNSVTSVLTVKAPIVLDIVGLTGNPIFCSTDPNAPQNNNSISFTGNIPSLGTFSLDDDSDFSTINNAALNATIVNSSGTGSMGNLTNSYNSSNNPGPIKQIFIQYAYTGPGCTAPAVTTGKQFQISSPPTVDFNGSTAADGSIFCNDAAAVTLQTVQSVGSTVVVSGFGVVDGGTGAGNATFTPPNAFNASVAAGNPINSNQNIIVRALATDINGCRNFKLRNYTVNRLPTASFTVNGLAPGASIDFCYTDAPAAFQGNVVNSWYSIVYRGTTTPFTENQGTQASPLSTFQFDPKAKFDQSVSPLGANALNTIQYDVIYAVKDVNNCVNTLPPVTVNVAPKLQVDFAGLSDGDIYCSNVGAKPITFSPFPIASKRSFVVNGTTVPLGSATYDFSQQYTKDGGMFTITYTVLSGVNNCVNPITKTINVLPSPKAIFSVIPKCKGDDIPFAADASQNTAPLTTTYTWTFQDQVPVQKIGQNTTYKFVSEGVYDVTLNAAYALNFGKVCQESATRQQVVGGIPVADFNVSDVCEGDQTLLQAASSNPAIFEYQWDFGDGETIGFGQGATNVTTPKTSGTFRNPVHSFTYKSTPYTVTLTGRTPPASGNCSNTIIKQVSILKSLTRSPATIYQMKSENGGDGYFVVEDRNGNSKWAFGQSSPDGNAAKQEKAWGNPNYLQNDQSYMNSPCFDLSAYQRPLFAIRYWTDTKVQTDGTTVQFSTDGGQTWTTLGGFIGTVSTGLDWYNLQGVSGRPGSQNFNASSVAWSRRNDADWNNGRHSLDVIPGARNKVRFRIAFASDQSASAQSLKGFAFSDVRIEERNRLVLAENFTNNTVSNSIQNNKDFASFKSGNQSEIVKLQYHIGLPTSDDINKQNPTDANARAGFYGLTNSNALVPKGYLDGVISGGNFLRTAPVTWVDTEFSLRSLVPSPYSLTLSTVPTDNDKIAVTVDVKALAAIPASKQALMVAVIEKSVGSEGFVVRKLLPSASGVELKLPMTINQQQSIKLDPWEVKNVGNLQQLAVVAFIQNVETKEVIQAAYLSNPGNLPTIITAIEDMEKYLVSFPNPADKELMVQLPAPATSKMSVSLIDQFGKTAVDDFIKEGAKEKSISTRELAAGLYILRLEGKDASAVRKIIVVHDK